MRELLRTIRKLGGRSIAAALSVLGLLYLWPDIKGLPKAYGFEWGQLMPDREIVAYIVLALALGWIIWIDVRPYLRTRSASALYGKLRIERFDVAKVFMEALDSPILGLILKASVRNHSLEREIFFFLTRALITIDGRVNPDAQIIMPVAAIHPNSAQSVTFAIVPRLERKAFYQGKDEIIIKYGSKAETLEFELEHEGVLTIEIRYKNGGQLDYNVDCSHRKINHRRI